MEYLLKASTVIVIFYICYKLFLQRETFFQHNRWFLLSGLLIATCLPFIVIPIYIEYTPTPIQDFTLVSNASEKTVAIKETFSWIQLVSWIYISGVIFFLGSFIVELFSLATLMYKNKGSKIGKYTFIEDEDTIAPFSFFNTIVLNPKQFNNKELELIINHEKAHANQFHSIDMLLIHLATVLFWFNPLIWFYKKGLQQNLEYIADYKAHNIAECKKSYQHILLKASVPNHQLSLTNNFYNSLIKKRIVMLHKNRSKNKNLLKLTLILPLLALFIMSFNTKEIFIEKEQPINNQSNFSSASIITDLKPSVQNTIKEKQNEKSQKSITQKSQNTKPASANQKQKVSSSKVIGDMQMVIITKDNTDADLEKIKDIIKKEGLTVKFKGIKRNSEGEITAIKINISSKESNANYNINSDDPIKPIKISYDRKGNNISIGNTNSVHFAKGKGYSFISKDGNHKIHTSGKGNSVFVYENDDDDVFILKKDGKVYDLKNAHNKDNIFALSGDDGESTIIGADTIKLNGNVIIKDKKVHVIHGDDNSIFEIKGNDDKNIWVTDDYNTFKTKAIGKGKSKFFISGDGEKEPLFILDGKEVSKRIIDDLDSNQIDKIEVLKGDSATKKYGKKGKDGVVIITAKKK